MARHICISVPDPPPLPSISFPIMGTITAVRDAHLTVANTCDDAALMLRVSAPVIAGLGLPICLLGCTAAIVSFVTGVPNPDDGFLDQHGITYVLTNLVATPEAALSALAHGISKVSTQCGCLLNFTPVVWCTMVRGIVETMDAMITCVTQLLADILALEAQAAALLVDSLSAPAVAAAECLQRNANQLLGSVVDSFDVVSKLMAAMEPIFLLIGITFTPIGQLIGDDVAEVITSLQAIQVTLDAIYQSLTAICPP
jgi:hypothetical protein